MMISKLVLIVAAAVLVVSAVPEPRRMIPDHLDFRSDEFIDYINNELKTTWKATRNVDPDTPIEAIKARLGAWLEPESRLPFRSPHPIGVGQIPEQFDSRERWPKCQTIKQVRDQGSCGSCWAHGTVEAISDRICVASNQTLVDVEISAENLMACCISCGAGCRGGSPSSAWRYYVKTGIVTGGLYGTNKTCQPYSIPECEHHKNATSKRPECHPEYDSTPPCRHKCTVSSYPKSYQDDLHFGSDSYLVEAGMEQIQIEIMTHGPVTAAFMVCEDFLQYQSGVYQTHCNRFVGAHAVKMIGWGVENGVPYWLLTNSWNADWGDHGFFKILRGSNECGIEDWIYAGLPQL